MKLLHMSNFKFRPEHIEFLREKMPNCKPEFFDWLQTVDCSEVKV